MKPTPPTAVDLSFRPRFRLETPLSCAEVESLIRSQLEKKNPDNFGFTYIRGHFTLRIHSSKRHFWSPQMDISVKPDEDSEDTIIRCLLAPAPVVWTMFMFFYALAGFGALVGFMIASSQYSLDKEMWGLWLGLGSIVFGLALFLIAQTGKKLARNEMNQLKYFFDRIDMTRGASQTN